MIGIVFALFAALAYSLSVVLVRKRLDESNFFSVALVLTVTGNIILWPLALLFTNLRTVSFEGVLFFVIAGMLAPGITRLLYYKGMEVVGVSVTASIFATYPVYSSLFAGFLLGEVIAIEHWIGIICIVVGVMYIERSLSTPKTGSKRSFRKGLVFPLVGTLTRTFSAIAMKYGLNIYNEPLLGVAIGYFSPLLLYLLLSISAYSTPRTLFSGKDLRLFWKAGAFMSLGWVLAFYAFSHENVSIVSSLMQIQPLFVILFTHLYLKELEQTSFKLIISAFFIVTGAVLVSIR